MALLPLVLVLVTVQIPCGPREFTDTCGCKQGMASACEALRLRDPTLADALERAARGAEVILRVEGESATPSDAEAASTTQESAATGEPPDCKGQRHHIISRKIARALKRHATLRNLYTPRDPRFVARAKDEDSHCGYQQWHRDVDDEVTEWLAQYEKATAKEFEDLLREIYSRPHMQARFPNGF